jgi:hypothetical protein
MTIERITGQASRAGLLCGLALAAVACVACKSRGGLGSLAHAEISDDAFANIPVPPADGPKLFALRDATPILDRPAPNGKKLGELRAGSVVARSKEAHSSRDCDGGWYVVRPRGFVCAGESAALGTPATPEGADRGRGSAPSLQGLPAAPDLTRPMPYRYGRARAENVPLYARIPTPAEQLAVEPDLAKRRARESDKDPLGAAANDVPLDATGVPTGPPVLLPGGDGIEGSKRTVASYFLFPTEAPPPAALAAAEVKVGALRKGSGVALTGSLVTGGDAEGGKDGRRFGVTVDGRLVPTDRLKPTLGSTYHGIDLEKVGLPVAFIHRLNVHAYALQRGKAIKLEDDVERRTAVPMSGKFRTVEGVRYEETRDGEWFRSLDLMVVVKRHKFPEFVKAGQKWLDVSIANQTLTAYEGTKPIFATLISSGRDQLKDPQTSASTARGIFKVLSKHVTRARDSREVGGGFDVADAPWVMEFEPGFALTGMYWGEGVGEAQGFHDIGLSPIDAHRIWIWADPQLPDGWHGVYEGIGGGTTFVNVRP